MVINIWEHTAWFWKQFDNIIREKPARASGLTHLYLQLFLFKQKFLHETLMSRNIYIV